MSKHVSSEEIINAIKTGNSNFVLQKLYKVSLPTITRYIMQNNGNEEEAKDIFQDAVITLFQTVKQDKLDSSKDVYGFLFIISKNLWINRAKKKNKIISLEQNVDVFQLETPILNIISVEKQEAIKELFSKIGTKCHEIIKKVIYENKSMKEIAQLMGFADENVAKSTHYRCKKKLIDMIQNDKKTLALLKE